MRKVILATALLVGALNATDFSSMDTQELVSLRGTVATQEREAFKTELQSRVSAMTAEQREELGVTPGANSAGNGHGTTARDGSGTGSMGSASGGSASASASGGFGGGSASEGGFGGGSASGGHGRGGMR